MNIENLKSLKEKLDKVEGIKNQIKEKKQEFEKSIESLVADSKLTETEIEKVREIIEAEALAEYKETKQKKLLGGIGIQERYIAEYDEKAAFNWAKEHKLCLQLDVKVFESLVKTQDLDFVKKKTEEKVTFPAKIKLEEEQKEN